MKVRVKIKLSNTDWILSDKTTHKLQINEEKTGILRWNMTQYVINSYLGIVVQQKSQSGQILATTSHIRPNKRSDALLKRVSTFPQITRIRVFIFSGDCRISSYSLLITFQKHSSGALPALIRRLNFRYKNNDWSKQLSWNHKKVVSSKQYLQSWPGIVTFNFSQGQSVWLQKLFVWQILWLELPSRSNFAARSQLRTCWRVGVVVSICDITTFDGERDEVWNLATQSASVNTIVRFML